MQPVTRCVTPSCWGGSLSGPPALDRRVSGAIPALVRRWRGIDPDIEQSALDHHYVSIHLGGAKRLHRSGEGRSRSSDTRTGDHSVVPAGAAFRWNTEGPVDFAHFYFDEHALDPIIEEAFDRDSRSVALHEALGAGDELLGAVASSILDELHAADVHQAYLDHLMHLLALRLLRLHSDAAEPAAAAAHILAPFRLRRAIEYIDANLAAPIGVADIATAAGISPYHFSRAFRQATGKPPYAFLIGRRLERARLLLAKGETSLTAVSTECGFASLSQFSRTFRRVTGVTPTGYRNRC